MPVFVRQSVCLCGYRLQAAGCELCAVRFAGKKYDKLTRIFFSYIVSIWWGERKFLLYALGESVITNRAAQSAKHAASLPHFILSSCFCIANISSLSLAASMKSISRAAFSISFFVLAIAFSR
jgi:hypothetical protein